MVEIGKLIKKKLRERGMSNAEFARRINTHVRNVYDIFKRKSLDTELLKKIGKVMDFDFFNYYKAGEPSPVISENSKGYGKKKPPVIAEDKIKIMELKIEELQKEVAYLKEINNLLKEKQLRKK